MKKDSNGWLIGILLLIAFLILPTLDPTDALTYKLYNDNPNKYLNYLLPIGVLCVALAFILKGDKK